MPSPPLQQRYPFDLAGKVHPDVEAAIKYAFSGLLDLNQANVVNVANLKALQAAAANTASTSPASSPTIVLPINTPPVASQWFAGYNASSGSFSQTQPGFADISGNLASGQLPTTGISVTVALAKLTGGGADGSLTTVNGIVTAYVAPS